MQKYIEALKGISYWEWIKLREGIDSEFEEQIGESKKNLRLTDSENVKRIKADAYWKINRSPLMLTCRHNGNQIIFRGMNDDRQREKLKSNYGRHRINDGGSDCGRGAK